MLAIDDRQPPILSGHRYPPNFRIGVGRDTQAVFLSIREDSTNGLLGVREGLFLAVTLSDDFRKRRNEHGKAAALLWLEDDRKAVVHCLSLIHISEPTRRTP